MLNYQRVYPKIAGFSWAEAQPNQSINPAHPGGAKNPGGTSQLLLCEVGLQQLPEPGFKGVISCYTLW